MTRCGDAAGLEDNAVWAEHSMSCGPGCMSWPLVARRSQPWHPPTVPYIQDEVLGALLRAVFTRLPAVTYIGLASSVELALDRSGA